MKDTKEHARELAKIAMRELSNMQTGHGLTLLLWPDGSTETTIGYGYAGEQDGDDPLIALPREGYEDIIDPDNVYHIDILAEKIEEILKRLESKIGGKMKRKELAKKLKETFKGCPSCNRLWAYIYADDEIFHAGISEASQRRKQDLITQKQDQIASLFRIIFESITEPDVDVRIITDSAHTHLNFYDFRDRLEITIHLSAYSVNQFLKNPQLFLKNEDLIP